MMAWDIVSMQYFGFSPYGTLAYSRPRLWTCSVRQQRGCSKTKVKLQPLNKTWNTDYMPGFSVSLREQSKRQLSGRVDAHEIIES